MLDKIIKTKKMTIYIFLIVSGVVIISYFSYQKLQNLHPKNFTNIITAIKNSRNESKKLKKQIILLDAKKKSVEEYLINRNELYSNVKKICKSITDFGLTSSCTISNIINPYGYINVAKIRIETANKIDAMVVKYIVEKMFNVKSINIMNSLIEIEVYNI